MNESKREEICPLCDMPFQLVYGRSRRSAQADVIQRVWIRERRCRACEASRPQEWNEVMHALYDA